MRRDTWERDENRGWGGRNGGSGESSSWNEQSQWSQQDRGGYGAQETARGGYGTGSQPSHNSPSYNSPSSSGGPGSPGTNWGGSWQGGGQYGNAPSSGHQYGGWGGPSQNPQFGSGSGGGQGYYGGTQYGGSQWGSGFGQAPSGQSGSSWGSGPRSHGGPYADPYGSRQHGGAYGDEYRPQNESIPSQHPSGWGSGYNPAPSMSNQIGMGGFTSSPFTPQTSFSLPHTAPSVPWNRPEWNEGRGHSDYRRGQWRGRTPKGYTRSDDRIRDDIIDRLMQDPLIDASDVEISVASGVVSITGTVNDRRLKHEIEDLAEASLGVTDVVNNLRVRREESRAGDGGLRSFENSTSTNASSMQSSRSSSPSSSSSTSSETDKSRSRQRT